MPVTHTFVSGKADGGDSTLVQPSNWNASHSIDTITAIQDSQTPLTFTRFFANFVCSYNSYVQVAVQNKSNGTASSSDFVATTDTGTDTTEYIDMGINGSGYTGTWGLAKDGYLYVDGGAATVGDLVMGTAQTGTTVDFNVGGAGALKLRITETYAQSNVPIIGGSGPALAMHAGMFNQ